MKRIMAVIMALVMTVGMAFPAMAMEKLAAPSWIKWRYEAGGGGLYADFEAVEASKGVYKFEIYKDGSLNWDFTSVDGTPSFSSAEMNSYIFESGSYTVRMKSVGDNVQTADSEWSSFSEPYVYEKPGQALGSAANLKWSDENTGIAEWTGIDDTDGFRNYSVRVYRDGRRVGKLSVAGSETSVDLSKYISDRGDYRFSVRAMSNDIENVTHSPEVMCETVLTIEGESYTGQLPAPSWIEWSYKPESGGLYATFDKVEASEGLYKFELYKDGEFFSDFTSVNGTPSFSQTNMSDRIYESGSYTLRMKSLGDNVQTTDSEWSAFSEPYVYEKPERTLDTVQDLKWSDKHKGTAEWSGIDDTEGCLLRYRVELYRDGKRVRIVSAGTETSVDLSKQVLEEGQYTFLVIAVSRDMERLAHSKSELCEISLDVVGNNNKVLNDLEQVNSFLKGDKASASNAEKALEELDIKELAIAVQSSEESLQAIADLERDYLELTDKTVEKQVGSGVNLEADEIQVIGAGLSIATDNNAIRVSFKKPEKEVDIDKLVYRNTVQFDISLTGAAKSLRAPITLIMPVPENILPSRLRILHFHSDGSSEIITPAITEDGKAKFTVTRFSIFAFAEEIDQNGNSGGYRRSSSSGGSKKAESQSGSWIQSEKGWWFKEADGSWPAGQWKQLMWNGNMQWYFFDQEGYMKTGWLDWNGKRYYLHAVSDGTMGHMYTGWRMIDGQWYYFDADGALLVNSATPDGYQTDSNGIWVQ